MIESTEREGQGILERDLGYAYPVVDGKRLDLTPDSDLHRKLITRLKARENASRQKMQNRVKEWEKIEDAVTKFVPARELDALNSNKKKDVNVVVGTSYMILDTLLAYHVQRDLIPPYWNFHGRGPEDILGGILATGQVEAQSDYYRHSLALYAMYSNIYKFGMGPCHITWEQDWETNRVNVPATFETHLGESFDKGFFETTTSEELRFEGNRIESIRPENLRIDPNFPIEDFQRGNFAGIVSKDDLLSLMAKENRPNSKFFNLKYLYHTYEDKRTSEEQDDGFEESVSHFTDNEGVSPLRLDWMYCRMLPKEWGIGNSEKPAMWVFCMANRRFIIAADEMKLDHGDYPITIGCSDFDGHSTSPVSKLESIYGLQKMGDWMWKSHWTSVMQALKHIILVDPYRVNLKSLKDTILGGIIFASENTFGQGKVADSITQLKTNDTTASHMREIPQINDMSFQISAAIDSVRGVIKNKSESPTATEVNQASTQAISRLEKSAQMIDETAMKPMGYQIIQNTKQFQTLNSYIRINGGLLDRLRTEFQGNLGDISDRALVTPWEIQHVYDVKVRHEVPGIRNPNMIKELLLLISQSPVGARFQFDRFISRYARSLGVPDLDDFIMPMEVLPNEEIQAGVQAGNLVPFSEIA